ncbi:MAG: PrgI family protein [Candidatus Altiarchaeota archaeon]|nr:PrgI family protein [Candidatus Altiarchaeota archaeon]
MAYKIPTDIRYEERLFGPLTVKQSIYALIAAILLIYLIFLAGLTIEVYIIPAFIVTVLAIGFIMFNLDTYLINYLYYIKGRKESSWISPAARKLMEIRSIRADAVFLKDNRVLGVVKIKPINFGVLSREDQDTVIYGFLEFVNSLSFPIQIVMRSINLDLSDYLGALKRRIVQRDDKMALAYYEHFSEYMYDYIKTNEINDRLFYIVVPAKRYADETKTIMTLEDRCKAVTETLGLSGIIAERLGNRQLLSLYASYFTDSFRLDEEFVSPITMYKRMWHEAPKKVYYTDEEL